MDESAASLQVIAVPENVVAGVVGDHGCVKVGQVGVGVLCHGPTCCGRPRATGGKAVSKHSSDPVRLARPVAECCTRPISVSGQRV